MSLTPARIGETAPRPEAAIAPPADLRGAYAACRLLARRHYENFPVASLLLPRPLRDPVAAIYAFARQADDFADEPEYEGCRLALLEDWSRRLDEALAGRGEDPVFVALGDTLRRHGLPSGPFRDLLSAFRQDATRNRYRDWAEVLDYCRRSANPVGRLVLHLFGRRDESLHAHSDAICTALQLTNFWQDLAIDAACGRIYVPREDLARHGISEESILSGGAPRLPGFRPLMETMARRTEELYEEGKPLPARVGGRLGFELRLTWLGGRRILEETRRSGFDVFRRRPSLSPALRAFVALRACFGLPASEG